jgi:hypothetical protein
MPFPSEETTPPVTNTNRVIWSPPILRAFTQKNGASAKGQKEQWEFDGNSG